MKKIGLVILLFFLMGVCLQAQHTDTLSNDDPVIIKANEKIKNFKEFDSMGIGMTVMAMSTVFLSLILLFIVFKHIGQTALNMRQIRAGKSAGIGRKEARSMSLGTESGEIFAAIALAIYEITEDDHDDDNTVLTIKKVVRNYSPWNSKIHSMRQMPR